MQCNEPPAGRGSSSRLFLASGRHHSFTPAKRSRRVCSSRGSTLPFPGSHYAVRPAPTSVPVISRGCPPCNVLHFASLTLHFPTWPYCLTHTAHRHVAILTHSHCTRDMSAGNQGWSYRQFSPVPARPVPSSPVLSCSVLSLPVPSCPVLSRPLLSLSVSSRPVLSVTPSSGWPLSPGNPFAVRSGNSVSDDTDTGCAGEVR
jgi:hypothetical protein